jgi:formylglycine-generating enzyme required for sulfatase activity
MVRLPQGYCIDSTEVTRGQYEAWLNTNPSTAGQISDCTWNTTFAPDAMCMREPSVCQTACDNHPQACVDWCDAYAYCRAVGKRLCGKTGGDANGYSDYANPSLSQWYNACASNSANNGYPYGNTYQADYCNGWDHGAHTTVPVGSMTTCQSSVPGYQGVFDLSGNLWEFEDSCDGSGQLGTCHHRGGSFYEITHLTCGDVEYSYSRNTWSTATGFRCCSSP